MTSTRMHQSLGHAILQHAQDPNAQQAHHESHAPHAHSPKHLEPTHDQLNQHHAIYTTPQHPQALGQAQRQHEGAVKENAHQVSSPIAHTGPPMAVCRAHHPGPS